MIMIVRFYGDLTSDEKVDLNVTGIPDGWPAEISLIDDGQAVPSGWIAMTQEQLDTQKSTYQAAYDAWVASRIPAPPTPDDDTSIIQVNASNGTYSQIIRQNPRRGEYAVFFNSDAVVQTIKYCIFLDDVPVTDSEREISFLIPTPVTLATHADIYVLDNQTVSVRVTTLDGFVANIAKRSMILVQKDG